MIRTETRPRAAARTAQAAVRSQQLRVAYMIQNVGLDLHRRVGDVVPVYNSLKGLQQAGHTVRVFELQGRQVALIDDVDRLQETKPAALNLTAKRPFLLLESGVRRLQRMMNLPYFAFFDSLRFYEAAMQHLADYDICHEHNGLFSMATAVACRRLQKPYVLTFSADAILESELVGQPLRGWHRRAAVWEAKQTYKLADRIICVSEPAKKHLVQQWRVDPQKIKVMPNGVDIALFGGAYDTAAVRTEWRLGDAPVITFVGGFQPWHGLENLVAAFAQLLPALPQARLLLVGDGPARKSLEAAITQHDVANAVTITGFVSQEQVPAFLAAADIAVLPYPELPQELWFSPLKLYEYMAAGKAIVASRSGQIAEVLQDGENGLLTPPGSIDALSQAMRTLLQDDALRQRLGRQAQADAVAHHSWKQYIRRLETVYQMAMATKSEKGS